MFCRKPKKTIFLLLKQLCTVRKSSSGVAHHTIIPYNNIRIGNIRCIKITGKFDPPRQIWSVQAIRFPKFDHDSGFMGTPTQIFPIGDLQAHWSSARLQKLFRKQSVPNHAHLGTCIHQYIRNHLFHSTPYSYFQVQLSFVSMWSMENSHSMQL